MLAEVQWNAWQVIACVIVVLTFIIVMEHGWPRFRK